MSRPTMNAISSLRPTLLRTLPSALAQPVASSSTSPSHAHFSTSPTIHASRSKQVAKRKKAQVIALRASRQAEDAHPPDPVLGHIPTDPSSSQSRSTTTTIPTTTTTTTAMGTGRNTWEGCRLQRTILTPSDVWSAPYSTTPQHYLPGLTPEDRDLLFGAVPHTTLTLGIKDGGGDPSNTSGQSQSQSQSHGQEMKWTKEVEEQEKQVGAMMKILDLRNASKQGIEVVNRQRIIDEFGRKRVVGDDGQVTFEGEPQSGGSEVQGMSLYPILFALLVTNAKHIVIARDGGREWSEVTQVLTLQLRY